MYQRPSLEFTTECCIYPSPGGRSIVAFNFADVKTGECCMPKEITRLSAEIHRASSGDYDAIYRLGRYIYSRRRKTYSVLFEKQRKLEILLKTPDFEDLFEFHKSFVRDYWGFGKPVMCFNDTCVYMYNRLCGYTIIVLGNCSEGDLRIEKTIREFMEKGYDCGKGFTLPEGDDPLTLQQDFAADADESVTISFDIVEMLSFKESDVENAIAAAMRELTSA